MDENRSLLGSDGAHDLLDLMATTIGDRRDEPTSPRSECEANLTSVIRLGLASDQAFLDQTVAHPGGGCRSNTNGLG